MMAFVVVMLLVAMVHLFTVTWATQNAHLRAREALMHGDVYLTGVAPDYVEVTQTPFQSDNYQRAEPDEPINFSARAWDATRADIIGSQSIEVTAFIVE